MQQIPAIHIETLQDPARYTKAQIDRACVVVQLLRRNKLILVEPPKRAMRRRRP